MNRIRISVAMATSVAALLCASPSFADDTTITTTTTQEQPVQAPIPPQTTTTTVQQAPAAVGSATTTQAEYVAPAPVVTPPPTDRYTERTISHRPNATLLSTGAGIFVLSYGSTVIAGAISERDEDKKLFIPVVGPWLDLGQRDCQARTCGSNEDVAKAMIITSGAVQGAGVLLALSSLLIPESTSIQEHTRTAKVEEKPSVHVLPVSFVAGAGVGAVGRF